MLKLESVSGSKCYDHLIAICSVFFWWARCWTDAPLHVRVTWDFRACYNPYISPEYGSLHFLFHLAALLLGKISSTRHILSIPILAFLIPLPRWTITCNSGIIGI